ncbi:MAG: hypothetical protein U1F43_31230 [Myxococcota bacterium]
MSPEPTRDAVLARAFAACDKNPAIAIASTGGPASPWVLGAYFARDEESFVLFLEDAGTTLANLRAHPELAFLVSENDAMKDFVQGAGVAEVLPPAEAERVMARLVAKLPWFKLYTPSTPVRIRPTRLHVSSFEAGWFPARVVRFELARAA